MNVYVFIFCICALGIRHTESACSTQIHVDAPNIKASSETRSESSSHVLANGWCANHNQHGNKWIEFNLGASGKGISGVVVAPLKSDQSNYFQNVLVQYVPIGSNQLVDFPFPSGKLEITGDKPTTQNVTFPGLPISRIRFTLKTYNRNPCLSVQLTGCTITELCGGACQNNGTCVQENICHCKGGYSGFHCEIEHNDKIRYNDNLNGTIPYLKMMQDGFIAIEGTQHYRDFTVKRIGNASPFYMETCVPADIPIHTSMVKVSSEDSYYSKEQLPYATDNRGWCPASSDKSPSVEIQLNKPLAVSVFQFYYIQMDHKEKEFMRDFELQYIAPTDSSKMFRTFAPDIPALNGTHFFQVTTQPTVVTDRLRIVPTNFEKRACFGLGIKGCDPKSLCTTGFCKNGGTCVGDNVCLCPNGFYGDSCQITKNNITSYNLAFTKIENTILYTTSVRFKISGTVTLNTVANVTVLSMKGQNSYITLDKTQIPSTCFADIDQCSTGFTIGLDIKFNSLVNNTFLVSSGGNIPGFKGIALYFEHNSLIYVVTTSSKRWTLQVNYKPVTNRWQHFEVTWNANLGIGLYVDGHLLGTFGRPVPVSAATQTVGLCIGCSHGTSQVAVDMLVKGIQTWALDRTNLVNARIVPAVTTTSTQQTPTTTTVSTVSKIVITSPTTVKSTSNVKTTPKPTTTSIISTAPQTTAKLTTSDISTTPPPFQEFNLTFQSIIGNILITPAFNFTVHGNPVLNLQEKGQTALVLNGSNQYVELPDKGIPCLEKIADCQNGFTMKLEVKFTHIDVTQTTYILSSGGDVTGSSGTALYMQSNQLVFAVKQGRFHWVGTCNITSLIQINIWYNIEVSWSLKGLFVIINGQRVIEQTKPTPYPGTSVTHPVLIGKTFGTNYTAYMFVRNLFTWTASREVLVSHGIVSALTTPVSPNPTKATTSTRKAISTVPLQTKVPTTSETTSTTTTIKTTTVPTMPTSTVPTTTTTTEQPIIEYLWNFTSTIHVNTTIYGQTTIKEGGMVFQNSSQFIDFGSQIECLTSPEKCHKGLTIQFTIQFKKLEENTYLLTSGGETPNGVGIAVVYRYGRLQFVLSTSTHSWFASCGRDKLLPNEYHIIMISWHQTSGLYIYIDNYLIDSSKVPTPHETTISSVTTVYFGRPHFTISATVKIEYLVQTVHIWYAWLEILVQKGICPPPSQVTTTTTQPTNPQPTTPLSTQQPSVPSTQPPTKQTPRATFSSSVRPTSVQQCPAGCVSIGATAGTTAPGSKQTTQTPRPKPSATSSSQHPQTPPAPDTASPPTATTARSIPEYHEIPTIHALVGKDKNAYLACTFKGATETDVVLTVSLIIQEKIILTTTVPGNTGIAQFSVAKIDDNLHKKKIRCSLKASYSGSLLTTVTTYSNIFIPQFLVTPNRLIVTEGHTAEHVTVTSTAPPQFYCCKSCKGSCQVHIVTSWTYDRHDLKCDKKVIAQAVVGSTKPQYYNEYICGFALTVDNWSHGNTIPVKATLDGRRDGDHRNNLNVIANVYNQPVGVTITVRPATSFHIDTVEVLIKDNYHSGATCKSVNDPHMTTFDGQRYDNMHEGQFILYRHKTLPFEVRADYQRCSQRSHAYCNCAVAVKSGDDVITIAGCQERTSHGVGNILQALFGHHHGHGHNRTPMTIQMYINGQLTAGTFVRRYGCGQKYEIELPTGTVITVQQSYKPFINIWIKASNSDWQLTEGLCGSYDGSRSNDLTLGSCHRSCVSQFIAHWKTSPGSNFFLGVGVSSQVTGDMYCSCVEGKESACSPGLGVIKCSKSRYDVTSVLVQQAKRPMLGRRTKRQAEVATSPPPSVLDTGVTLDEAMEFCEATIMNNTVTQSCTPIITSNITERIEDCAKDYNATGMKVWALDHIRDIAFDCVNAVAAVTDSENNNNTMNATNGLDLKEILENTCVDACVHGSCSNGICECDTGYSGETCNISAKTKPTISPVPYLCDVSETDDCKIAMVYGDNFVQSDNLKCHFDLVEVTDAVISTGAKTTSSATFISLNQVACMLPSQHSATIRISNDGSTLSDSSTQYVVYSSVCYDCYIVNDTVLPKCKRKENNCIINGVCYRVRETSPENSCHVCLPDKNNSSWSTSNAPECVGLPLKQKDNDDMGRTQIIILAVVCAVFGALIIVGLFYTCRKRIRGNRKKASAGYEVTALEKTHRDEKLAAAAMDNPTYDYRL